MKKILILFFIIFSIKAFSQKPTEKNSIQKKYNEALTMIDEYNYQGAIDILEKIKNSNVNLQADIYKNIGICQYFLQEYQSAKNNLLEYKKEEKETNQQKHRNEGEVDYLIAMCNFKLYKFELAKEEFRNLEKISNKKQKKLLERKIEECDSAKKIMSKPIRLITFDPSIINSDYPDYSPVITSDQSKLYFTSRRPGSTGGKTEYDGLPFEDIYEVDLRNGRYSKPKNLGPPVNTPGHEATTSVSPDGKELFIYKWNGRHKGDIFVSYNKNGKWTKPVSIGRPINSRHNETHASLSPDMKHLFFTSDRRGGYGGLDIYESVLKPNGKWGKPKNLGKQINTKGDEDGPFMSPDGKTFYFCSNGRFGMGGYDIYKSTLRPDGQWTRPVNMGYPLNTSADEVFYEPTANPNIAYYSSKNKNKYPSIFVILHYSKNNILLKGNVYSVKSVTKHKIIEQTGDTVLVNGETYPVHAKIYFANDSLHIYTSKNGFFTDSLCKIPYDAKIKIYSQQDTSLKALYYPSLKGNYILPLKKGKNYLVYYSAPGYIYKILKVYYPQKNIFFTANLDTLIYGKVVNTKKLKFDKNSDTLNPAQKKELNILANFMKKHNQIHVDISTYGTSDKVEPRDIIRKNKIIDYLLKKGIAQDRIHEDLSSDKIRGDYAEYTLYDSQTIENAISQNSLFAKANIVHGILVNDVTFAINMYDNPDFYNDLSLLAKFLSQNKDAKIAVYGYTDTQGNKEYNKILSEKRADFVKNYLISKGASASQIVAKGKGYSKQISINKDKNGRYVWNSLGYNRRVEIEILHQGKNQKLFVKPVDVPNQYKIDVSSNRYSYSVLVVSSKIKLPKEYFSFNVIELLGSDGIYNYIHGNFASEQEASDFVRSIKDKFPKAFVFINNFRH
jgi:outer membrane protein OmpA-like peptidoglycan-associated protein